MRDSPDVARGSKEVMMTPCAILGKWVNGAHIGAGMNVTQNYIN